MTQLEKLEELYAALPTVRCQRKCGAYCGHLLIPKIEAKRLEEKRGFLPLDPEGNWIPNVDPHLPPVDQVKMGCVSIAARRCLFLGHIGEMPTCLAYKIRPFICRVWGCVDVPLLRCPYGCVPTRWMSGGEFKQLYQAVIDIQEGYI